MSKAWETMLVLLACASPACSSSEDAGDAGPVMEGDGAASDGSGSSGDGATEDGSAASGDGAPSSDELVTYGDPYTGGVFHLGPVDWEETEWHNACASESKYPAPVQSAAGNLLAGLWNGIPNVVDLCDACIHVETAQGKSALLRVVTYGDTTPNSIDVSPEAYALLDSGEHPRDMTWRLAKCDDTGNLMYEFKQGAHEWWSAFWVRNARVPLEKVEVKSANHDYLELTRESDGSFPDYSGFGIGEFTIRVTGIDGQSNEDTFTWPSDGISGKLLEGSGNLD
jgi:expansin (peptidoglycan-binding protein)